MAEAMAVLAKNHAEPAPSSMRASGPEQPVATAIEFMTTE